MSRAFDEHLQRIRPLAEQALAEFFAAEVRLPGRTAGVVRGAIDALESLSMRGGKRLRAALCALSYEGWGGALPDVMPALVAIELLQTYFLVHDDWMDHDDVRRGGPTVHVMLRDAYGTEGDALAVLAGDYACAAAQRQLATVCVAAASRARAYEVFASMQGDVIAGQLMDVQGSSKTLEDVEAMYTLKTGSYTVAGPLLLGAALAGAGDDHLRALSAFAQPLGVAFQLRDDLLGTFGQQSSTGKAVYGDLRRKKRTSLLVALEARGQGALVKDLCAAGEPSDETVLAVAKAMEVHGIREATEARVAELSARARAMLPDLPVNEATRTVLAGAIAALGERSA